MIPIFVQNDIPLVWKASDWQKIREEHKMIGNLVGCLVGLPRQETFQGLPLALLKEEVTLLLEKNMAYVIKDTAFSESPSEEIKQEYLKYKEDNKKQQMEFYENQRKEQITLMIDRIIEGKRRKLLGLNTKRKSVSSEGDCKAEDSLSEEVELDREKILKSELNKSTASLAPPLLVQTFTSEQWLKPSESEKAVWTFPETDKEKLKYHVFKDLWEKGLYITEGHKFGVDYLVYPGDPIKFHAQFLVVCVDYNEEFPALNMISYARLASISRKTLVIASQQPNSEKILYQSIQWADNN